jgi:cytochrome c-type biogenesis protein CcmH
MIARLLLIITLTLVPVTTALAVEPDEILSDPVLEERAREVSRQLRCVVCQNQDIDSSNAGIAREMRILVREHLMAGDTNADILEFMVARYGNYVLLRPPFNAQTYALWFAPLVLALFAGGIGYTVMRQARHKTIRSADLTTDEEAALQAVLETSSDTEKNI